MKKVWWLVAVLVFMGLGLVVVSLNEPLPLKEPLPLEEPLPLDYWDAPQAAGNNHAGLENNMRPEACAQCHQEQFNAWRDSKHAHGYSPGLVGQFPGMGHGGGNDCLVCHAPLAEQLYRDAGDMEASLSTLLEHLEGFSRSADLDSAKAQLPLRHAGVTCAVCHVRQGKRFGPPRRDSELVGQLSGAAHGGFIATKDFEKSQLCASCHQFPQSYAINGKPLENTVFEWKQSRFAQQGVQCQSCHMPDRKHAFKGIHDVEMVRSGLKFEMKKVNDAAALTITSVHIGHAFPTYVTPKVLIKAEGLNIQGDILQQWEWLIVREVAYENGWKEVQDTRLTAGESRSFVADELKREVASVRFYVDVIPDAFYKNVYRNLLKGGLQGNAKALIKQALFEADGNDYRLYEEKISFK